MITLTKFTESFEGSDPILVRSVEIAAVEPYHFHSFRPAIARLTLQSGKQITVWETVDEVQRRMEKREAQM